MGTANTTSGVLDALRVATRTPAVLLDAIEALQEMVWNTEGWAAGLSEASAVVLKDLAYDLEYYVADPDARAEDASYFGEERAIEEIRNALERVKQSEDAG